MAVFSSTLGLECEKQVISFIYVISIVFHSLGVRSKTAMFVNVQVKLKVEHLAEAVP